VILSAEHEERLIGALVRVVGCVEKISESKLNELLYEPGLFVFLVVGGA